MARPQGCLRQLLPHRTRTPRHPLALEAAGQARGQGPQAAMTLKVFRDAYIAARFLEAHGSECRWCALWSLGRRPGMCPAAQRAVEARNRADALLDIDNTRE